MTNTNIKFRVDNREIYAKQGENLLHVCLENDIYIPNLCWMAEMEHPPAACRLCFVEIDGYHAPQTSCTTSVKDGMVVRTDTPAVRRLQQSALRLLLSTHDVNCRQCSANKKCELQRIAKFLKIGLKPSSYERHASPLAWGLKLKHYPNRCVLCGKCIYICEKTHERSYLSFVKRGMDTIITFHGGLDDRICESCSACVEACPVGAMEIRNE